MRRSFPDKKRGVIRRQRKPVMFLSLEGNNKTERLYFTALNKDHGERYSIQFTSGIETDVNGMVKSLLNNMKDAFDATDGDKAFCVCDADFEPYKQDRIRDLKRALNTSGARIIISNPCFELWYLNHFYYSTRAFGSMREIMVELNNHIFNYKKSGDYYLSHLKEKTKNALAHSQRQTDYHNSMNAATDAVVVNPDTEVIEIVNLIVGNAQ